MTIGSLVRAWIESPSEASSLSHLAAYHTHRDCEFLAGLTVEQVELTPDPRLLRRTRMGGHLRTDTGAEWRECIRCRERRW